MDMQRKLQAKNCLESGDMRAHLHKLQAMREDLEDPLATRILPQSSWAPFPNPMILI